MDEKQRQEVANFRYGLIAPLVTRTLNPGEQAAMLREIAGHTYDIPHSSAQKISLRTLERYLKAYREGGWESLLPSERADKLQCIMTRTLTFPWNLHRFILTDLYIS